MTTQTTETTPDVERIASEASMYCSKIIAHAIRSAINELVMPAVHDEQARLINERDEARAVLKEIEWHGDFDGNACCPCCWHPTYGHEPDCKLAKVLNA